MISTIIYNGRAFSEFGVFADLSHTLGSPEKDYDLISIPGRNGDLSIFNDKFKDIEFTVHCYIKNDFVQNYRNLIAFLNESHGYLRFETSKEPDYYREALFLGGVDPIVRPFNRNGSFDLAFRCHPQRWLKWAEEWIDATSPGTYTWTIDNPTNMPAKPMLQFKGNGTISFYGSGSAPDATITVTNNADNYVEIDCETFDCYSESLGIITNRNADVSINGDPELVPGHGAVVYSSSYTSIGPVIEVMPRFFVI